MINDLRRKLEKSLRVRKNLCNELKSSQEHVYVLKTTSKGILHDESDTAIVELMEKNDALTEQLNPIKKNQEAQGIRMGEIIESKGKDEDAQRMVEKEKRKANTRLTE